MEVDHVIALSAGGEMYALTNLASMCRPCHFAKTLRENIAASIPSEVQAWSDYLSRML